MLLDFNYVYMKRFLLFLLFFVSVVIAKAGFYGPYSIDESITTPANCTKVVVFDRSNHNGGWISLRHNVTNETVTINNGAVYLSMWYCYISNGSYIVTGISDNFDAYFGGSHLLSVGDNVVFSGGAAIIFEYTGY